MMTYNDNAYSDYTSMIGGTTANDISTGIVAFHTRSILYPLKAGSYHYKIFKL